MMGEWIFTKENMHKRARLAYDKKVAELYKELQDKIFAAVEKGEFSITLPRDQVDERYLLWLQSFDFPVYVRQIPKPWTEFRDGYDLSVFDEVQVRW